LLPVAPCYFFHFSLVTPFPQYPLFSHPASWLGSPVAMRNLWPKPPWWCLTWPLPIVGNDEVHGDVMVASHHGTYAVNDHWMCNRLSLQSHSTSFFLSF
jgi:hypothetical protein